MLEKGDFHVHSTSSDGNLSPTEIVKYAKKRKVDIIALTDHNNVNGIDEAISEGKKSNVVVIPGVELSTKYKNNRVHVLGYFKDDSYKNELFIQILRDVKLGRIGEIKKIFKDKLDFHGYRNKLYVETGIKLLKFFGATVVLAHPVLICKNYYNEIFKMDFDGIEAKYFKNTEKDTEYFINLAEEKGFLYTAGSDFHRMIEEYRIHGLIGDVFLNKNEIEAFLKGSGLDIWTKKFL